MKKRSLTILFAMIMTLIPLGSTALANNTISVYLDGTQIQFDVLPQIINDRTMVPLRAIFEALGANIDWNNDTRTVTATRNTEQVIATIDSNTVYINGEAKLLDVPPMIVDERTLVPLRFVAESFGANVEWVSDTQTVLITTEASANASTKTYSHFGINYDIPTEWGEPTLNGKNVYYYPANGMLMLSQFNTSAALDNEALGQILDGIASGTENYKLLSTNSITLTCGLSGYSAQFTGTMADRDIRCKTVFLKIGNSVVSLSYVDYDIDNTDIEQFDNIVNSITLSGNGAGNSETNSSDNVPYYESFPNIPDFGDICGIQNTGDETNGGNIYKGATQSDIDKYLSIMKKQGFQIGVGKTIYTCKKGNTYVDIAVLSDSVLVGITVY